MSSVKKTQKTKKTQSNCIKKVKNKNIQILKQKAIRKDLERMRKSKQFRELGDMLYID